MDVQEFNKRIKQVINTLDSTRDRDVLLLAKEARALIVRRIQNEGEDVNNKPLGNYSTNPLPDFYYDSILTSTQKKKFRRERKKKGRGLSYKEVRDLAGRQTKVVDLTFTGKMWANTVAILEESTPNKSTATITGKTIDTLNKLGWASDRYGNVLRLTKNEQTQIENARIERLINVIKTGLFK